MTGPKINEGGTVAGERIGTNATAKYLRGSATKAREVLDLIRGLDVRRADEVLQFTDREMGAVIRKVLASAVANAEHNDSQGRDELYVAACFADEGPTLRRFRPRARGRATRIRKRTCHITIVVARMSRRTLERKRRREEAQRPTGRRGGRAGVAPTASRRARVAKSRQAAAAKDAVDETVDTGATEDEALDTEADGRRRHRGHRDRRGRVGRGRRGHRRRGRATTPTRSTTRRRTDRAATRRSRTTSSRRASPSRATPTRCSTTCPAAATTTRRTPRCGSTPRRTPRPRASRSRRATRRRTTRRRADDDTEDDS